MDESVANKINEFFSQYRSRQYVKGQILILNGDEPDYIYHLVKGNVKQYDVTYRGDEIILNIFKPPAFFPMSVVINQTSNPYIYEAETDIELHQAPAQDVVAFLKANPDVVYDLLSRVYRGIDGMLGRLTFLMAGNAKSRLVYELIVEARRFGEQDGNSYFLTITEKDLGARAGLSRETVSREIGKLKREKLVESKSKGLLITDMPALEKKLGQEI